MEKKVMQNRLVHGGAGAVIRVSKGESFIGVAENEEKAVRAEYEDSGAAAIVANDAVRLQVCSNLYWSAVLKAAADGDLVALDRYVARFGWLQSSALRAWSQVAQLEKNTRKRDPAVILDVYRQGKGGDDASDS